MKYLKWSLSGLLSGLLIGLAGFGFLYVKLLTNQVLGALVFPIGLLLICILKADLFTGKIGLAIKNSELPISRLIIMLITNLIGATLMGLACHYLMASNAAFVELVDNLVASKTDLSGLNSLAILLKGVLCGFMVYLAVFLYKNAQSEFGKTLGVFAPIFLFVLLGFEHCIANMFYFAANLTFNLDAILAMLLAIAGNSLGAIGFHYLLKGINLEIKK